MIRRSLFFILATALCLSPAVAKAVGLGDKAPLFSAVSDKGEVKLGDYLGKKNVVLAFYFAINTSA